MNMLKLVPIALLSIGLTACGGESNSTDIKAPKLSKGDIEALNNLQPTVNRDHDWNVTASSEDRADTDDIISAVKFSADKPFNIDRVDADLATETHKIFTYEWQGFKSNDEGRDTKNGNSHRIEVSVPGLATTQDQLKVLLRKDDLTSEEQIRKAVYANFALPMALGATELGAYRSFDALTNEPVIANNEQPLCKYTKPKQQNLRADFSMSCTIPATLSPFKQLTTVTLDQQIVTGPAYYKTSNGDTYETLQFLQTVSYYDSDDSTFEVFTPADVLIHPGIGIVSMDLTIINGLSENGIETTQTKWEWFNDNANILDQDY
ncbi:hypothetical protein [Vibrio superstes]|uniref:Lipoprotein n=1 Tax=Vibrio superstes NBRC 103154 TaxID=1219062 RepID=A0A511QSK1_9VIBR|nr:hypothetical protein [Vibrio superstes]GEM80333.1 hypothetical protein VSU01S_25780 [Vibrio superstes NBRC 103154]